MHKRMSRQVNLSTLLSDFLTVPLVHLSVPGGLSSRRGPIHLRHATPNDHPALANHLHSRTLLRVVPHPCNRGDSQPHLLHIHGGTALRGIREDHGARVEILMRLGEVETNLVRCRVEIEGHRVCVRDDLLERVVRGNDQTRTHHGADYTPEPLQMIVLQCLADLTKVSTVFDGIDLPSDCGQQGLLHDGGSVLC